MSGDREQVAVYLDAPELGPRRSVGVLSRERAQSRSVLSFAYDSAWVDDASSFALEPALPLYEGDQYPPALPGIFADAAPDRWGRTLLERREALTARREGRRPRRFDDWDFLLGVNDATRMGALRLSALEEDAFLDDEPLAVPPSTRLRELEHWAGELEERLPRPGGEEERWIAMLVAPGSSLGGARPKANFLDDSGDPWIAKFPSRQDRHDVGAWEYVAARLGEAAGVAMPEVRLLRLGSPQATFCARRFDRQDGGRRLYASAMTLAGRRDNEEAGYLDIARAIVDHGDPGAIDEDLRQLFRRLVLNLLISNHDDHLRNHGFIRTDTGWRLAPAFDVNPSPNTREHSLALDATIHFPDLAVVRETAPLYRLSGGEVESIVAQVREAVGNWRREAEDAGIAADEIESVAPAFELL